MRDVTAERTDLSRMGLDDEIISHGTAVILYPPKKGRFRFRSNKALYRFHNGVPLIFKQFFIVELIRGI